MEEVSLSFVEHVNKHIVKAVKKFFAIQAPIKGLEHIVDYRWVGDDNGIVDEQNTKIHIISYFADTERLFPSITINVDFSAVKDVGFGQLIEDNDEYESVGGLVNFKVAFNVESLSGLDIQRISDILIPALVLESKVRRDLEKVGIILYGAKGNILGYGGSSSRSLVSGTMIRRVSWNWNDVMTQWNWTIGIEPQIVEDVKIIKSI